MKWYLIHTKPKQEKIALRNLEQQGYECFLPLVPVEKIRQASVVVMDEPLFSRYLFIRLGTDESAKSWTPIRSTTGVSQLVTFGNKPVCVLDQLISVIQDRTHFTKPRPLFVAGDCVEMAHGPFTGLEAIYQMGDGEGRALILLELLSRPTKMWVDPVALRKRC